MMDQKKILVVDDEDDITNHISRALKKEGHQVITASSYSTAIQAIDDSKPDLIISDVMMPYTGGLDIVEHVKTSNRLKKIPIILVTGMDVDVLYSSSIKAEAVVSKPFDMKQLIAIVKQNIH